MKKLLLILSVLICFAASAQGPATPPYTKISSTGYWWTEPGFFSALNLPVGCGYPSLKTRQWAGSGAVYWDSCYNSGQGRLYLKQATSWKPILDSAEVVQLIAAAGGGSNIGDSLANVYDSLARIRDTLVSHNARIIAAGSGGGGGTWGSITGTLSDQTDLQGALDDKQDNLVSGTNIKTINGNSLLGSGDIEINAGEREIVGTIFDESFSSGSTPSGWSQSAGAATISYSGGALNISGGNGNFSNNYVRRSVGSMSNNVALETEFTVNTSPSSHSDGFLITKAAYLNFYGTFKRGTSTSNATMSFRLVNGSGNGTAYDSVGYVPLADGNKYRVLTSFSNNSIFIKLSLLNVSGGDSVVASKLFTAPISGSLQYAYLPTAGYWGLGVLGGDYKVTRYKQTNYDTKNADVLFIGTSITQQYLSRSFLNHYAGNSMKDSYKTYANLGSGGSILGNILSWGFSEIDSINPKTVVIEYGVNESNGAQIRFYKSALDSLKNRGYNLVWLQDFKSADKDTVIVNLCKEYGIRHINPGATMITSDYSDGIHPNEQGFTYMARFMKAEAPDVFGTTGNIDRYSFSGLKEMVGGVFNDTINVVSKYKIGGTTVIYMPDQNQYDHTIIYGNGGVNMPSGGVARFNTAAGIDAGRVFTSALRNTAVGARSMYSATSPTGGVAVGDDALYNMTTGLANTGVGSLVLYSVTSNSWNAALGYQGLYNATGSNNTSVGGLSGMVVTSGSNNSFFGYQSGYGSGFTGAASNNSFFGYRSGFKTMGTAERNILLGSDAVLDSLTGDDNIVIGNSIELPEKAGSNQLTIGNLIFAAGGFGTLKSIGSGKVGIKTSTPRFDFEVNGTAGVTSLPSASTTDSVVVVENGQLKTVDGSSLGSSALPSQSGNSGKYLTTDGTNASWATVTFSSGTGTPTATGVTNYASSSSLAYSWSRIGNIITITMSGNITATAGSNTLTQIGFSLPVPSNLSNVNDVKGGGVIGDTGNLIGVAAFADVINHRAVLSYNAPNTNSLELYITFQYEVK